MRPYSRKNSGYGSYNNNPHDQKMHIPQEQNYIGMDPMRNAPPQPQMMYQHIDQFGNQVYYQNSPILNAPPTPFDSAYGATLLPSHLLMGSPYLASPNMKYTQQQYHFKQQSQQNNYNNNNRRSVSKSSGLSNKPISARGPSKFNPVNKSNSINDTNNIPYNDEINISYQNNIDEEPESIESMEALFNQSFVISYKVLPKGDDVYRTRSLLFQNIDKSIDLHSFISKYVKSNSIESVYTVDRKIVNSQNGNNSIETEDNQDNSKHSILLSFLTKKLCLDFYNSVLQRLKEFKKHMKSESLNLSFVSLTYIPFKSDENEDHNNTFLSSLQNDIIPIDSTRSIAVEFTKALSEEDILNKLDFLLAESGNSRYILEAMQFVKAKAPSDDFNENYIILTFLNIPMASEILKFLNFQLEKYDVTRCFFVSILPDDLETQSLEGNGPMVNELQNSSMVSLQSTESSISLGARTASISNQVDAVSLKEYTLVIDPKDYSEPSSEIFEDHLPNISLSLPNFSDQLVGTPMAQEMYVNDMGPVLPTMSPSFGPIDMFGNEQTHNYASSVVSKNGGNFMHHTPGSFNQPFYGEQPSFRGPNNIVHPITDSLENQMHTSAQIASAMGSDAGNRTVYIGNIHPRSRPEDICNVVRGGVLQNIRFIESKHICFVTFIEASAAVQFYANAFIDPIVLHGNTLKLGWGNFSGPLPKSISLAVTIGGSRNVYVSLPDVAFKDKYINNPEFEKFHENFALPSPDQLRIDFSTYGAIEQINYLKDSHCCWVNFMNITSAIKLVEEANNKEDIMNEKFDYRYQGLIINYGKDRCGNVNRNLVAGKNSKFYNKVKRKGYDIRLSKLEEKRKNRESKKRDNMNKFSLDSVTDDQENNTRSDRNTDENKEDAVLKLDSLGISINTVVEDNKDTEDESEPEHQDNNNDLVSDFLTGAAPDTGEDDEEDEALDNNTDSSSDIEFIINSPGNEHEYVRPTYNDSMMSNEDLTNQAIKTTIMNSSSPVLSKQALEVDPPFAPDTISRDYAMQMRNMNISAGLQNEPWNRPTYNNYSGSSVNVYNNRNNNQQRNQNNNNSRRGRGRQNKTVRTIPGSDVMAQYLAQLQHSTFMYAANILGATADEPEQQYEE